MKTRSESHRNHHRIYLKCRPYGTLSVPSATFHTVSKAGIHGSFFSYYVQAQNVYGSEKHIYGFLPQKTLEFPDLS